MKRESEVEALFRRRQGPNRNRKLRLLDRNTEEKGRSNENVAVVCVDYSKETKRKECEMSKRAGKDA